MGCGASAAKTAPVADEAPPSAAVAAHAAAATAKNVAAVLRKGSSGVIGGGGDGADGAPPSDAAAAAAKEKRRKKKEKKAAKAAAAAAAAAAAEAAAAPKATGVSALSVMQRLRSSRAVTAAEGAGGAKAGDRRPGQHEEGAAYRFFAIKDQYSSLDEVSAALRAAGLESSNLIVAIDFTKSNTWTGRDTYGGRSLHDTSFDNPYQLAIRTIGTVMAPYDDDNLIPVFGFGDSTTTDKSVFPFFPDRPARGFPEVLERYKEIVPRVHMSGPTNFAPAIEAAIQICERTSSYHILIIIADGQVTNRMHTEAAIVRASAYPLSIILVGVGDGPWDMMEDFDDSLPQRRFDNFQFVNLTEVAEAHPEHMEVAVALACLMELPDQYIAIRSLGLI